MVISIFPAVLRDAVSLTSAVCPGAVTAIDNWINLFSTDFCREPLPAMSLLRFEEGLSTDSDAAADDFLDFVALSSSLPWLLRHSNLLTK